MRAMSFEGPGRPLRLVDLPRPEPGRGQLLLQVRACAVCRTDLHIADGELRPPRLPIVPGHEIVGTVVARGEGAFRIRVGARVGVPWLASTCGQCSFCRSAQENLCDQAKFTGFDVDGGFAEYAVADERFCFELPAAYDDLHAAPLLCAGLIGYRSYRMAGAAERLGLYGFGAAAHLLTQLAVAQGRRVFAFTREGDGEAQALARRLGAEYAGPSGATPPEPLDAAILFAPVGALVPAALRAVRKGGVVVCGGIHMSDIPRFPYSLLWGERAVRSVANLTRRDGDEFLELASRISIHSEVQRFALEDANAALARLREGALVGAAVLVP